MLKKGAKVDLQDGCRSLHYAAEYDSVQIIEALLKEQADINIQNEYRRYSLTMLLQQVAQEH